MPKKAVKSSEVEESEEGFDNEEFDPERDSFEDFDEV